MADQPIPAPIGWADLTVPAADSLRDFYSAVTGWQPEPLDMGGYSDYVMKSPSTGQPAAGICHSRGPNSGLPPVWLIYINVPDLDQSLAQCLALGGHIIAGPNGAAPNPRYAVIQDPAGAHAALYQPASA
jgi:predicted enzyme related to lactoylglutathione lyase